MVIRQLECDYLCWLVDKIRDPHYEKRRSYSRLIELLYTTEFTYTIMMDRNRAEDGLALRYEFAEDSGYGEDIVAIELSSKPCSMLEMMVSLADRIETHFMTDMEEDHVGKWFWTMIVNMGLADMDDRSFDYSRCQYIIQKCLNRDYAPNGEGGCLFVLNRPTINMRTTEIWYQMNWYLDEILNYR